MAKFELTNLVIDETDRTIIDIVQSGISLTSRPFLEISKKIQIDEEEIILRLQRLKESGFIRKNAIATNHYKLGYVYNAMTVWDIDDDKIQEVGAKFKSLGHVSHCYERPRFVGIWNYNLFAMIHDKNNEGIKKKLEEMTEIIAGMYRGYDILLSTQILKKTGIRIRGQQNV